jgi:uncharacterized membrane protein (UPF0127 family)
MKLKIGEKHYSVKVADNDSKRKRGLSGVKASTMPKNSGLVLKYDEEVVVPITMDKMKFPLDIVFMKGGKVVDVRQGNPGDPMIDIKKPVDSVLELKYGEGGSIKVGDSVSWIGSKKGNKIKDTGSGVEKEGSYHVLDEDGNNQVNLHGSERVYSRIHTKQLYDLSVKAKSDNDFKSIGRAMMRILNKQDTQEQETVKD